MTDEKITQEQIEDALVALREIASIMEDMFQEIVNAVKIIRDALINLIEEIYGKPFKRAKIFIILRRWHIPAWLANWIAMKYPIWML